MVWLCCGTTLLERDPGEHLLAQDLPNQRVNRPGARHVHESAPRINAVIDPWLAPVAPPPDEALGEVGLLCQGIRCLDFQATLEAYVYVRLHDGVQVGGETLLRVGEVPNVTVGRGRAAVEHRDP